jgi:hypothetical protein
LMTGTLRRCICASVSVTIDVESRILSATKHGPPATRRRANARVNPLPQIQAQSFPHLEHSSIPRARTKLAVET